MIKTRVKTEHAPDGDGLELRREIIIKGGDDDIVNDLRAIGYGLAKRAGREAKKKHEEEAMRTRYETAFTEGMRMDQDELKEADKGTMERYMNEIMEEIQNEWVKEMNGNGGLLS